MIEFELDAAKSKNTILYIAKNIISSQPYWFAFVAYGQGSTPPSTISISKIWKDMVLCAAGDPPGDFIFARSGPSSTQNFLDNIQAYLSPLRQSYDIGYFVWLNEINSSFSNKTDIQSSISYGLSSGIPVVLGNHGSNNWINFENISLNLPSDGNTGANINLDKTGSFITFSSITACQPSVQGPNCITLHAEASDSYMYGIEQSINLQLDGATGFTFTFQFNMQVLAGELQNDFKTFDVSMKYFFKDLKTDLIMHKSYPAFGLPTGSTQNSVLFNVSLDPLYPLDTTRSLFLFNQKQSLISSFTTDMGHEIVVTSDGITSGLVFTQEKTWSTKETPEGQISSFYLSPIGNFYLSLTPGDTTKSPKLMCGLSATEAVGFVPAKGKYKGDLLVFYPNNFAFAPVYPLPVNIGTSAPIDPSKLLSNTYLTSWINIIQASSPPSKNNFYYSQPPSSALYAAPTQGQSDSFLWFFEPPSRDLSSGGTDFCFPAVPYSLLDINKNPDAFTADTVSQFENQIIFPCRKNKLTTKANSTLARRSISPELLKTGVKQTIAATPQGLLASVDSAGNYNTVQLANNNDKQNGSSSVNNYNLQFENLTPQLTDALQTNQLFMVATNATNIGEGWSPYSQPPGKQPASGPAFENFMSIEGWPFVLNIGSNSSYGSYTNVLLFKFCPGAIVDLISHPEQWTQSSDFNNQKEIQAVAGWLQTYVSNAVNQYNADKAAGNDSFYSNFYSIINDKNWNGILCLKVDISLTSFPQQLQGLLAGIDLSKFNAHHFGINVNQVSDLKMQPFSSLFGLIDYEDPAYIIQQQQDPGSTNPVPPQNGQQYDFKVLKLEVLFENSQVADFSSEVQVTMTNLFGDNVTLPSMPDGSPSYNSVVLQGSYQDYDGTAVYVFDSKGDNPFMTGGNVLTEVEIVKVEFNTLVNQGGDTSMVSSRFSMQGFMHFAALPKSMDIFSFGDMTTAPTTGSGLYFSNLYIDMDFDVQTPSAKTMTFDSSQIAFDVQQSTARDTGLYSLFPLEVTGFISGNTAQKMTDLGYLTVNLEGLSTSSIGKTWNGIVFTINLGSPGALAASVGFSSSFVLVWGVGSKGTTSFKVAAGIQLPGTKGVGDLMGIESVLKLGIDSVKLSYVESTNPKEEGYLLMLNEIALKFLGLLSLPPSGSTNCYIFGNPSNSGQANSLAWYAVYIGANWPPPTTTVANKKQLV